MTPSSTDLRLQEELLLIALRDETGTPESRAGMFDFALAGGILAELTLESRVSMTEEEKPAVEILATRSLGNEILDECLEMIATAKRQRKAADWISRLAHVRRLRVRVAEGLCRRGILEDSEARVLLVFKRKAYPTINPEPEAELVERMRRAIESDDDLDPRTAVLIALADGTGMLRVHFDKALLKTRRERLDRIAEGQAAGGATRQAIQAAQAAAIAVTTATTMAATSAATH